ncbi:MAG: hypothetical protein IKG96_03625 [Bacteroidaceae bacterium]|nr:hypothetical protein [Bacteroidaceae bacterium]MBR3442728.1 hypothetical protein [Bacteroidaceae bacterium]
MSKKLYFTPVMRVVRTEASVPLMGASAPDEGIGYGGEGNDEDDPNAKQRDDQWGDLW